ncbi:hypothetical protein SBOR_2255 [Sclerotinia borealis F-4128]|uniref:PLD phosphodiesterase domain-containing protein n=1 Tax=Sclerotinia borealis (strain F-4128) TaxID=1432307 RepID=W9CNG3_SCLBF|nr:hypothetical protein SBOR_2255 [Sclerotinia borealis F-4128]
MIPMPDGRYTANRSIIKPSAFIHLKNLHRSRLSTLKGRGTNPNPRENEDKLVFCAIRGIKQGEEFTTFYMEPIGTTLARRKLLLSKYGFKCMCKSCLNNKTLTVNSGLSKYASVIVAKETGSKVLNKPTLEEIQTAEKVDNWYEDFRRERLKTIECMNLIIYGDIIRKQSSQERRQLVIERLRQVLEDHLKENNPFGLSDEHITGKDEQQSSRYTKLMRAMANKKEDQMLKKINADNTSCEDKTSANRVPQLIRLTNLPIFFARQYEALKVWLVVLSQIDKRETSTQDDTSTTTRPTTFQIGTGTSIWSSLLPELLSTNHELIIVTCFWASSSSQRDIHQLLLKLSERAVLEQRIIHIRICFSSISLLQKLFHTASPDGYLYPSSRYPSLGLPSELEIPGLDLRVKSIFFRACHVLHGKYIIQDTRQVWFPSCNVSWEAWGEGCVGFEGGGLVDDLRGYWGRIWDGDERMSIPGISRTPELAERSPEVPIEFGNSDAPLLASINLSHLSHNTETILLPHTHSFYNPFSVFFNPNAKTPSTPLNTFLLSHISTAKSSISIYTPNLTYTPVINALCEAIARGVDVRIVVSRKLMVLEQIVTACTITEWEVWKMKRRYSKLVSRSSRRSDDPEAGYARIGNLEIVYFNPALVNVNDCNNSTTRSGDPAARGMDDIGKESRPVKLHLKMTIIDNDITVLGSGNMDRASWVTSQELGIAIFSEQMSRRLVEVVRDVYG